MPTPARHMIGVCSCSPHRPHPAASIIPARAPLLRRAFARFPIPAREGGELGSASAAPPPRLVVRRRCQQEEGKQHEQEEEERAEGDDGDSSSGGAGAGAGDGEDERRTFLSLEEAGLVEISGLSTHERFLCRLTISSLNLLRVIAEQEGVPIEELNAGRVCDWFLKDKLKREQNLGSAVLQWDDPGL